MPDVKHSTTGVAAGRRGHGTPGIGRAARQRGSTYGTLADSTYGTQ